MRAGSIRHAQSGKIGAGCLIALAVGLVVVVGGGYALYKVGIGLVEDEVAKDLADNPVVLEHVGEIRELDIDFGATADIEKEDRFVFRVVGTKASGRLEVDILTGEDELEHVTAGTLTLDGGAPLDLFPGSPPPR